MAVSITHSTVATGADDPSKEINKDQWNAALLTSMATARFLGRLTAGAGEIEELTAAEMLSGIGAEAAGAAASAIATHEAAGNPHPVYLTQAEGDALYDALNAASAAVSAHEGAANPHPIYLTQAEADALYAALVHTHVLSDVTGLVAALAGKEDAGVAAALIDLHELTVDHPAFIASGALHAKGMVPDPGVTAGTSRFLREDATWAAPPGGGSLAVTETEVDLGSTPTWRGKFTITDANIGATSKVKVWQAPGPYTGKGTRADECEMDWIQCHAVPAAGSATVHWRSVEGYSGFVGGGGTRHRAVVIGQVRGNVKFHYAIGA